MSNWTKGKSKARLRVPHSLEKSNVISKTVIRKAQEKRMHKPIAIGNISSSLVPQENPIIGVLGRQSQGVKTEPEDKGLDVILIGPPKRPLSPYIFFSQEVRQSQLNLIATQAS